MNLSISNLRKAYQSGDLTPINVIEYVCDKISNGDQSIWIARHSNEELIEMANALAAQDPKSLPLYGIPFAIKDNIDYSPLPTTAACPDYSYTPTKNAFVVDLLIKAGAIPIGKTNLDQFATGLVGTRSPYGIPINPIAPDRVPGGSSSGSAVAVSAGQVSFALGTDTAGSGRVPAAFNGLVGVKPSRGIVSTRGAVPACKTLDCVAVFTADLTDAEQILTVINQYDPEDPFARKSEPKGIPFSKSGKPVIGIPETKSLKFFGDTVYQKSWDLFKQEAQEKGVDFKTIDCTVFFEAAKLLYDGPWVAERYCAVESLMQESPDSLHPVTRAIIEKGIEGTAVDTFKAIYKMAEFKRAAEKIFETVHLIITPTAGAHFTLEKVAKEPIQRNSDLGYYTNFMNLLDLAAVSIPVKTVEPNRPFGISLFAPAFSDKALLEAATTFI